MSRLDFVRVALDARRRALGLVAAPHRVHDRMDSTAGGGTDRLAPCSPPTSYMLPSSSRRRGAPRTTDGARCPSIGCGSAPVTSATVVTSFGGIVSDCFATMQPMQLTGASAAHGSIQRRTPPLGLRPCAENATSPPRRACSVAGRSDYWRLFEPVGLSLSSLPRNLSPSVAPPALDELKPCASAASFARFAPLIDRPILRSAASA